MLHLTKVAVRIFTTHAYTTSISLLYILMYYTDYTSFYKIYHGSTSSSSSVPLSSLAKRCPDEEWPTPLSLTSPTSQTSPPSPSSPASGRPMSRSSTERGKMIEARSSRSIKHEMHESHWIPRGRGLSWVKSENATGIFVEDDMSRWTPISFELHRLSGVQYVYRFCASTYNFNQKQHNYAKFRWEDVFNASQLEWTWQIWKLVICIENLQPARRLHP